MVLVGTRVAGVDRCRCASLTAAARCLTRDATARTAIRRAARTTARRTLEATRLTARTTAVRAFSEHFQYCRICDQLPHGDVARPQRCSQRPLPRRFWCRQLLVVGELFDVTTDLAS